MYDSSKAQRFCCNCKKVTLHKYQTFGSNGTQPETPSRGFIMGLLFAIFSSISEGQATGDYKCTVCGTYFSTPDHLD
ncbi:hypothetical protein [Vibrio sp. SCSIO 43136]|uniref:hypothetical protein n=1 Tax=Vibrio sp. SCSIO 43136 TaxID=2819101 RepID=UPI002075F145|nr:hypothetical protein [Vibrio sp. SCSIO 43136]USD67992.1 hypothetical protein J4N39_17595 [Vibrio sp. SCSIO 43136]